MINKICSSPIFTSNVRVVYNRDFGLSNFYSSPDMLGQIQNLDLNGKDDVVTLLPEIGRYEKAPRIGVQVMQRSKDKEDLLFTTRYAYEPNEIITAYKEAKEALKNEQDVSVVRKDVKADLIFYMV